MRVDVGILIGKDPYGWAQKTIQLGCAAVPGMKYDDGTWGEAGGRPIGEVDDVTVDRLHTVELDERHRIDVDRHRSRPCQGCHRNRH